MAILTTLPAVNAKGQSNRWTWITEQARNQGLTKQLVKADWEALAGMTPEEWQSLLQC
jgi:hypothetical protein